jgi:hypothetical protein
MALRIGIDFDNTIVCYDGLFHRVAREQKLIPPDVPANKGAIRDYLRSVGQEERWTLLQGYVYGSRMAEAQPFAGVLGLVTRLVQKHVPVFIVSHKTRYPYLGPRFDLHAAALTWLQEQGFFDPIRIGMRPEHVFFELTKQAKLQRIAALGCSHFIDDLPELLGEPEFPASVARLLFDPGNEHCDTPLFERFSSWDRFTQKLLAA